MNSNSISESIDGIQQKFDLIKNEWDKGEERNHLHLKEL